MLQLLRGETIKSIAVSPPARVEHRGCKWVEVILIDPNDPIIGHPIVGSHHRMQRLPSTIESNDCFQPFKRDDDVNPMTAQSSRGYLPNRRLCR
jgi:hypothetical protein